MNDLNIEKVENFGLTDVYSIISTHSKIDCIKVFPEIPFVSTFNSRMIYTLGQPKVVCWYGFEELGMTNIGLAILDSATCKYNTWHKSVKGYDDNNKRLTIGPVKLIGKGIKGVFSVDVNRTYDSCAVGNSIITINITKMNGKRGSVEDLITPTEPEGRLYVIDDGDMFYGTLDEFRDCFFSDATKKSIKDWCKQQGYTLQIVEPDDLITVKMTRKELKSIENILDSVYKEIFDR